MAHNLGTGVSYVYEEEGYNFDTVVFQKGKPPLDSEMNLCQELQNILTKRQTQGLPSGWLSFYPAYTSNSLSDSFYTQTPTNAKPEYALVNGHVIYVTNTQTQTENTNLIELGDPPSTGNVINGVFLEVWRALLDPDTSTNKPDPATIVDALADIFMFNNNNGWISGDSGLMLKTENGGQTWSVQQIDTTRRLNGVYFITSTIGWTVGNDGVLARTSSGGERWTLLQTNITQNLNSIYAASQLIAWAVGDSGTILKTTNGISFLSQVSGITANLNKVHFYDTLVGWAVGDSGTILKTTNGGTSWIPVTSGTSQNLNSVFFYDMNFGYAVGDNGTILRSSDGGSTWVSQSGNIYTGSSYTTTTEDLRDVTMVPTLDRLATNEEVSSQLSPTDRSFTVANYPITKGDGKGTTTNNPADITVTVNGTEALVDSVNGTNGTVLLNSAPPLNATVLVTYYYKEDCAVFQGRAWIVGTSGTILFTDDIGAQWTTQTSNTAYDLNGVSFANQEQGWSVGDNSIIRNTQDHGQTWTAQESDTFVREVQRIFYEGNVHSSLYLEDNSIHPDAKIETTKRVQVQYKIRVIDNADPGSNPEAGLSSGIYGLGPNATGTYAYENMGPINGDYGCWRAQCLNTVDGYVYAIPMFFVNRRNSATYDPETNPNGSHQKNSAFVRPDLLTATDVVDTDILDVRRRIVIPSISEFLYRSFDQLSSNTMKTRFFRSSEGGDRYGTELLQVDRVGGTDDDGGTLIDDATMADTVAGLLSSEVTITTFSADVAAGTTVPSQYIMGPVTGIFHYSPAQFKAVYVAPTSTYDGKPIAGAFSGFGTNQVIFTFDESALTTNDDPALTDYRFTGPWFDPSETALTYIPSEPKLVKNFSGGGDPSFFYHGVLDTNSSRVIETWDSGIPDYDNYSVAYLAKEPSEDSAQQYRAGSVEIHYFMRVSSTNLSGTNQLKVPRTIYPDTQDVPYSIYSIRRVRNRTSGFNHRISNITVDASETTVTSVAGFEFIVGTIVEVVAIALSDTGDNNVRNGAAVNFSSRLKKIDKFNKSITVTQQINATPITITVADTQILGVSSTETADSLNQQIYWTSTGIRSISVTGFGTDTITISDPTLPFGTTVTIQLLVEEEQLTYMDDTGNNDGLLIGYNFIPPQCQGSLPTTLTGDIVSNPNVMYTSCLGSGGGTVGEPYITPLMHIPINDVDIQNDSIFHNMVSLQFANFKVDTGFVQIPVNVPWSYLGESLTFSISSFDNLQRPFYSVCSKELEVIGEGLQMSVGRKVYIPIIMRVNDPTNTRFMHGEYLLVIFSRSVFDNRENVTGYFTDGNCSISIYRLPNRPISRV